MVHLIRGCHYECTHISGAIVEEAIQRGTIPTLDAYSTLRREVRYGTNSRIDILLEKAGQPDCYVEVKNVTMLHDEYTASFPDSVISSYAEFLQL